ncbi:MAG: enoyl-CoA hydratase-related protein [Chloroflexota bacterium]|nr:enoyl-CoA hydratase-related protein [Chloroflexota bacterium]
MSDVLRVERSGTVARVTLARPEVRNTFNAELIAALRDAFEQFQLETPGDLRAVVLSGEGKVFCAGADIEWQLAARDLSTDENEADVRRLQEMLATVDNCPVPVVAAVHGAALGGGLALCCVADVTLTTADAIFGFTEVKLGLIPAAISPFVLSRIGEGAARALFLSGERFGSERALRIGVVSEVLPNQAGLDARLAVILDEILSAGPESARNAKDMVRGQRNMSRGDALDRTMHWAARQRVSAEGQEGLGAFLEKRPPSWRE